MTVNAASRATMTAVGLQHVRTLQVHWDESISGSELGGRIRDLARAVACPLSDPLAVVPCKTLAYDGSVHVWWTDEDADYIRSRSARYLGAIDLEPEWTQELMADERLLELSPYPASRVGASGFIGYSSSAGRVLVVIAYRDADGELHGMNAWPASGRDLATYNRAVSDDEEA